jgi:hypothetical protein
MREGLVKKLRETAPEVPWREPLELACRLIVADPSRSLDAALASSANGIRTRASALRGLEHGLW